MTIKIRPYLESLSSDKATNDKALAKARAEETRQRIALSIAQKQTEQVATENAIAELTQKFPLDMPTLITHMNQHQLREREIKVLGELAGQLFPTK